MLKSSDKPTKVALRGGFSDRMGIHKENTEIQMTSLDNRTRIALVNAVNEIFFTLFNDSVLLHDAEQSFLRGVLADVYIQKVNKIMVYDATRVLERYINRTILEDDYDAIFSLLEYIVNNIDRHMYNASYGSSSNAWCESVFNGVFDIEYVGYRFIDGIVVPITEKCEVKEINDALEMPFDNVKKHLEKALLLMADREKPDYENSIKESISAVEAMCVIILGTKGTLGDALKKIEKKGIIKIHPSLKEAFVKLYGYTADSDAGIRHSASLGGKDSTFEEARYMVVSCSSFINYLKLCMSKLNK